MKARVWIMLAGAGVVAALGWVGWWAYERSRGDELPVGILAASGRIEAEETRVTAAVGARVLRVLAEEGDYVKRGEALVELDARAYTAAEAGVRATLAAALENVAASDRRIEALVSQLDLARIESVRFHRLFDRDAAPRQAVDRADATLSQLESEVRAARAGRELAVRQVEVARAQVTGAALQLSETTVLAPVTGFVEDQLVREGEMAAPGVAILRLTHADEATVRVYLPIADAQRLRVGVPARAYVEGLGEQHFEGVVERVASEAEFTPRDIHMPDDRVTLVHAVTLRFRNPDGALKDGFPADVFIRWDEAVPWPTHAPWR